MDPATIAMLIQTLGPIIVPLLSLGLTWLVNKFLSGTSPATQQVFSPFLPVLAGVIGTVLGSIGGSGPLQGAMSGLAATGLHQLVHQPAKAAKARAAQTTKPA
jgi:hypothetical protein